MIRKLRIKFISVLLAVVAILLTVSFTLLVRTAQASLEAETVADLRSAVTGQRREDDFWHREDKPDREDLPPSGNSQDHDRSEPEEREYRFSCFVLTLNADGKVIDSAAYQGMYLPEADFLQFLADRANAQNRESGLLFRARLRYFRFSSPDGTPKMIFLDASSELAVLGEMILSSLGVWLGVFSLFVFIALLLSKWMVDPVARAWTQQRQFVADASHELKTPLTVILTNAELLQDPSYPAEEKDRFSQSILTMTRQMRGLTEQLLELARLDGSIPQSDWQEVNLSQLAEDQVLIFEPVCFEQGLTLESDIQSGVLLQGVSSYLTQLVEILLDNARKYASGGPSISLTLTSQGGWCQLTVTSPGPPIPPEVQAHLFERFYRADQARSRDGSYGLGLSIAWSIVQRHRGKIWVESQEGENRFHVRLPLSTHRPIPFSPK